MFVCVGCAAPLPDLQPELRHREPAHPPHVQGAHEAGAALLLPGTAFLFFNGFGF